MSNSFTAGTQIVHGQVLMPQFTSERLNDKRVRKIVDLIECKLHITNGDSIGHQEVRIEFEDGAVLHHSVPSAFGVDSPLSNEDIVENWRKLTKDSEVINEFEQMVLSLKE